MLHLLERRKFVSDNFLDVHRNFCLPVFQITARLFPSRAANVIQLHSGLGFHVPQHLFVGETAGLFSAFAPFIFGLSTQN